MGSLCQAKNKEMKNMIISRASLHFIYSPSGGDWPALTFTCKTQIRDKTGDWTQITWKYSGKSLEDSPSFHLISLDVVAHCCHHRVCIYIYELWQVHHISH